MNVPVKPALDLTTAPGSQTKQRPIRELGLWVLVAALAFHLSYLSSATPFLVVIYLFALVQLGRADTWRGAFYAGLLVGFLIAIGKLDFFWRIFGASSIALWLVYAFWIGLFVVCARLCLLRLPPVAASCAIPIAWCGLEYFRSELYYLRFAWLTPGMTFGADPESILTNWLGVYGIGFVLMTIACAAALTWQNSRISGGLLLVVGVGVIAACGWLCRPGIESRPATTLSVAGVQLEFPSEKEVLVWLNELARRHPEAQLLVLSEYTFGGPVPTAVKSWCREHQRYLLVGAKEPASNTTFYNVACVVSSSGEIVFRQAKSVPIQFFDDGLRAPEQSVWESPWGKLGICICYDLSYTRVTDRLIALGAQALIVPTMDVADWGRRQHELHARIGPIRAAEYHLPVFRLASSGISQAIDSAGRVISKAPFPGDGAILSANLSLSPSGRLPLDRWCAPIATALTGLAAAALAVQSVIKERKQHRQAASA